MSSIIRFLVNQFSSKKMIDIQYIDIKPLIEVYKSIKGNRKTTFVAFVKRNNLEYIITKRNSDKPIAIDINNFNHRSHKILVSAESIAKIENFIQLLERNYQQEIEALDDLTKPSDPTNVNESKADEIIDDDLDESKPTNPESADGDQLSKFDIIELTKEEKFKDIEDHVVDIEVRGERTQDGILFNANDIGEYLGMKLLNKVLKDDRYSYEKHMHWVELYQYSYGITTSSQCRESRHCESKSITIGITNALQRHDSSVCESKGTTTSSQTDESSVCNINEKPIWRQIYLTLNGLLKVIFSSKSANENIIQLRNWVIQLVFTHQFGSIDDRENLAVELTNYKCNLNDIPGIYCIRIGKVKDLRESLKISEELYPAKEFDSAYVIKFGRAEDIMSRFAQHCARTGYGRYGKISLDWFVMMPKSFLAKAESNLAKFFKSSGIMFEYNDGSKDHNELIIVKPGEERKQLKNKYKELIGAFPNTINDLSKQMSAMQAEFEQKLEICELKSINKISKIQSECNDKISEMEKQLIETKSAMKIQELIHKNEILELKIANATA